MISYSASYKIQVALSFSLWKRFSGKASFPCIDSHYIPLFAGICMPFWLPAGENNISNKIILIPCGVGLRQFQTATILGGIAKDFSTQTSSIIEKKITIGCSP
jgi:hypothetical protein